MQQFTSIILALFLYLCVVCSCESDYSFRGDANSIKFSADTLMFDTIFTGEVTPTTSIRIYNQSGEDMTIDKIYLNKGTKSAYNININGYTTTELNNIRMSKGDSLYVFINVSPSITTDILPFLIEDEVVVESGANTWRSTLVAYGQNAIRIKSANIGNEEWTEDSPYLLYGTSVVDSLSTLNITQGARVYFTENASIEVKGRLNITGTLENPVLLRGSRLEKFYDDIPGQWGTITLMPGSRFSVVEYAEIANGSYGIVADSSSNIRMRNVIIRDCSQGAILAYGAKTELSNMLLYNCNGPLVAIYGGDCSIVHATMSNYFRWDLRNDVSLYVSGEDRWPKLTNLLVANSIITGNLTTELALDSVASNCALVTNTLIKLGPKWDTDSDARFCNIINEGDPKFENQSNFDFHLDSTSVAINAGNRDYSERYPLDFDGNNRLSDKAPDLGTFEMNLFSK